MHKKQKQTQAYRTGVRLHLELLTSVSVLVKHFLWYNALHYISKQTLYRLFFWMRVWLICSIVLLWNPSCCIHTGSILRHTCWSPSAQTHQSFSNTHTWSQNTFTLGHLLAFTPNSESHLPLTHKPLFCSCFLALNSSVQPCRF